ncbi:hypothetical protein [Pseudomonas aeruginosa]|uniref:hypothetical protein n=1 Tax=Pseudomonas aeruginosa TaxID=287 RepID=UPI0021ACAAF5|nr:hypothetical protein [Pseudomonas aeruginosa]
MARQLPFGGTMDRHVNDTIAPARCLLAALDYQAVAIRYNNTAKYDGNYNHGSS